MKINRNNYEEFFLLYIDGELNHSEMNEVEVFVANNPDLKVELELLKDTVLPQVDVAFNKSSLHKSTANYQPSDERMLSFVDQELSASETKAFAREIAQNPALKAEVDILMSTKLNPLDTIFFAEKSLLYRKESGKVVAMRFMRIAVAAAVLLLMLTTVWVYLGNKPVNDVAGKIHSQGNSTSNPIAQSIAGNHKVQGKVSSDNMHLAEGAESKGMNNAYLTSSSTEKQNHAARSVSTNVSIRAVTTPGAQSASPAYASEKKSLSERNKTIASPVPYKETAPVYVNQAPDELMAGLPKRDIKQTQLPVQDDHAAIVDNNDYAKQASMKERQGGENENTIFYMPEEEAAKTKVGGIFKKVKRAITRQVNNNSANGITIGGFQIALK